MAGEGQYSITIQGMDELIKKLGPERIGGPALAFLEKAGHIVEAKAKQRAPVDRGRLRASISTQVEGHPGDIAHMRAVVGTSLTYAPFVEFGTKPHWPPLSALQPWARRHGFPPGNKGAFLVARKIAQFGTPPRPYLLPALAESGNEINALLKEMAQDIEQAMERD